jgi:hypothetical protein
VAPGAGDEPADASAHLRLAQEVESRLRLEGERLIEGQVPLPVGRGPIGAQAPLRQGGQLTSQTDGGGEGGAGLDQAVGQPHAQGLLA